MSGRALVLGSGGMLAHEALPALREAGWEVLGLSHGQCSVTDEEQVRRALARFHPDLVLNCAAYTAVDRAESESDRAFEVNARGAGLVARSCARLGAALVHLSTDFVFDGQADRPYREEDLPRPLGVYARSKLAGEEEVLQAGCRAWVVRTGGLYGHQGASFFRAILSRAARGESLRVVDDQWTSPTWTRDLARQLVRIVQEAPPGLYHATAQGQTTWFQAACRAVVLAGLQAPIQAVSSRVYAAPAPRPPFPILENAALQRLDLDLMRPWEKAAAEWIPQAREEWAPPGGSTAGAPGR